MAAKEINWDAVLAKGFHLTKTDSMFLSRWLNGAWVSEGVLPYGALQLEPSATVLNYGQGIFEGIKAFRLKDGQVGVFRPDFNSRRCQRGAERFLMPSVPKDLFLQGVEDTIRNNWRWIPPHGRGALYLRPVLFGSGPGLGVGPSSEYIFCIYASPVGAYFSLHGDSKGCALLVQRKYHRAVSGGSGGVKAIGNYASCFAAQAVVKKRGYNEILYLDETNQLVEEAGASNFFAVQGNTLFTPSVSRETILDGCTRDSLIALAQSLGYHVVEELPFSLVQDCSEAFCCGTGAGLTPVGRVDDSDNPGTPGPTLLCPGPVTLALSSQLHAIQWGLTDRLHPWVHLVAPPPENC
mmetsp:Transcript_10777/g.21617  ORF Transcript_10777/g.21617 Transcript_10777/m.21617 type:complete len:351 (-) Transcript_10777:68-1120(-)